MPINLNSCQSFDPVWLPPSRLSTAFFFHPTKTPSVERCSFAIFSSFVVHWWVHPPSSFPHVSGLQMWRIGLIWISVTEGIPEERGHHRFWVFVKLHGGWIDGLLDWFTAWLTDWLWLIDWLLEQTKGTNNAGQTRDTTTKTLFVERYYFAWFVDLHKRSRPHSVSDDNNSLWGQRQRINVCMCVFICWTSFEIYVRSPMKIGSVVCLYTPVSPSVPEMR